MVLIAAGAIRRDDDPPVVESGRAKAGSVMTEPQFRRSTVSREVVKKYRWSRRLANTNTPLPSGVQSMTWWIRSGRRESWRAPVPSAFISQRAHRSSPPSSAPYAIFVPSGDTLYAPTRSASYESRRGTPPATATLQSCIVPVRSLT